jgi:tripeptidyl-peptidase-1
MYWNLLLVVCLLTQSSYALGIHQRFDASGATARTHERRIVHDADSWLDSRKLEGTTLVPLRIALKQQNLHTLSDHLMSVSDPGSSAYGQHWSHQDLIETFSPSPDAHDTVKAWLLNAGFEENRMKVGYNKAWLEVQGATVTEVERLLGTEYRVFKHANGDEHAGKPLACFFLAT